MIDIPDPEALEGEAQWAFATARLGWSCFCYRLLLQHYKKNKDSGAVAGCLLRLGQVVLAKAHTVKNCGCDQQPSRNSSNHRKLTALANRLFVQAADRRERMEDYVGQAECVVEMAAVAMEQSHSENAKRMYSQALHLFEKRGLQSKHADCLVGLADVARRQGSSEEAVWLYKDAAARYAKEKAYLGLGNCYLQLGDISLERDSVAHAHARYKKASKFYVKARCRLGCMQVLHALGDIEFKLEYFWDAATKYGNALTLAKKSRMRFTVGLLNFKLGCCCSDRVSRQSYFSSAKEVWGKIGREDLIRQWLTD